jgi:hypothetical protein
MAILIGIFIGMTIVIIIIIGITINVLHDCVMREMN